MSHFEDLTPNTLDYQLLGIESFYVGLLKPNQSFPIGETSQEFRDRLHDFCLFENIVCRVRSLHNCQFCSVSSDGWVIKDGVPQKNGGLESFARTNGEIRVLGETKIYASTALIYHYVVEHKYKPPEEFIEAVLTSPEAGSKEHKEFLRKWEDWG